MCYHQGSRLRLWQGKRRQSQRKSQNLDPKGKENTALGQNGEAGRGNQFLNKEVWCHACQVSDDLGKSTVHHTEPQTEVQVRMQTWCCKLEPHYRHMKI